MPRFDSTLAEARPGPILHATGDRAGFGTPYYRLLSAPKTTTAPAQTTKVNLFYVRSSGLQPSPITGHWRGHWPLIQSSGTRLWNYSWLGLAQFCVTKREIHVPLLEVERGRTRQLRRIRCKPSSARCRFLDGFNLAELERCRDTGTAAISGARRYCARWGEVRSSVASIENLAWPRTRYRTITTSPGRMAYPFF